MSVKVARRQPYRRSMKGWWRRDPFFMRYMVREATAIAVGLYSIILTAGVVCLVQGEAAWNGWLHALQTPWSLLLHLVLLVAMAVHAYSWFAIMPKTMPMVVIGGRRLAALTITRIGWMAAVFFSIVLCMLAWKG